MNHRILSLTAAAVTATAALLATPALALAAPATPTIDTSGVYQPWKDAPGRYVCDGSIVSYPATVIGPVKAPVFNLDPTTGDIDPDNPRYGSLAGDTPVSYLPHTTLVYLDHPDRDAVQLTDGRWVHWSDLTNGHNCGYE